jgi:hypothetical protein
MIARMSPQHAESIRLPKKKSLGLPWPMRLWQNMCCNINPPDDPAKTRREIMAKIVVIRNQEVKLTLPAHLVKTKSDGTLWGPNNSPLIVCPDNMDREELRSLAKNKKFDQIPRDCFLKMGENDQGTLVLTDKEWADHPIKKQIDIEAERQAAIEADKKAKEVTIFLSSRGWGDYSSVDWTGDITRPDDEILSECKGKLQSAIDVDHQNQTDTEILEKIEAARSKWLDRPRREQEAAESLQRLVDTGYCFYCESWCHGDCGHYSNDPATRHRREFKEAVREEQFGINE